MKTKITYDLKCMRCNAIEEYTLRDENVNSNITDSDFYQIQRRHVEKVYSPEYCDTCMKETLQMYVGWDYLGTARPKEEAKGGNEVEKKLKYCKNGKRECDCMGLICSQ